MLTTYDFWSDIALCLEMVALEATGPLICSVCFLSIHSLASSAFVYFDSRENKRCRGFLQLINALIFWEVSSKYNISNLDLLRLTIAFMQDMESMSFKNWGFSKSVLNRVRKVLMSCKKFLITKKHPQHKYVRPKVRLVQDENQTTPQLSAFHLGPTLLLAYCAIFILVAGQ